MVLGQHRKRPSISVITVVYNNIEGIEQTIESVLSRTYPSIEYIVIDGEAIPHPTTLIKRSLFETIGQYDESLSIVSDWKWFIIAIMRFKVRYKYTGIVAANFHLDGISSKKENEPIILNEKNKVLQEEFAFNLSIGSFKEKNLFLHLKHLFQWPK